MKANSSHILAVVLALMLVGGCATAPPEGARLSSAEAVRLAKEAAVRDGVELAHYGRPTARLTKDQRWFVMFEARGILRSPGDFFAVSVDDRTGATQVLPGK